LTRLLSLLFVTQLAAIYLAIARNVDPGPVEVLQRLKQKLAEG
jgi:HAMP domain-containing protein